MKEMSVADQRLKLVRLVDDRILSMTDACIELGISRTTGHKIANRFRFEGVSGLENRSRAPHHSPQSVDQERTEAILALKATYPTWGSKKLRASLQNSYPDQQWPARSTIDGILKRANLVTPRRLRLKVPHGGNPLTQPERSNHVWCIDYKGQFAMGDGQWCYPLTITDDVSRYLLRCQALGNTCTVNAWPYFVGAFQEFGLPEIIRSDNGAPFASSSLTGLTSLSLRFLKLGIIHERMQPGKPTQNARHERMHKTLKAEALPARNEIAQQECFDNWRRIYNFERPHEGIAMATPSDIYQLSPRIYPRIMPELQYTDGIRKIKVRPNGNFRWKGLDLYISQTLAGEYIGLEHFDEGLYAIYVGRQPLAVLDELAQCVMKPSKAQKHLKNLPLLGGE